MPYDLRHMAGTHIILACKTYYSNHAFGVLEIFGSQLFTLRVHNCVFLKMKFLFPDVNGALDLPLGKVIFSEKRPEDEYAGTVLWCRYCYTKSDIIKNKLES
jgi:hypothetical protein